MHRFRVNLTDSNTAAPITGEEHRHISRVLRLRAGDEVELTDGTANYLAVIETIGHDETVCRILRELPSREVGVSITLYMGAVKGEKMDWIVQKCCELGAKELVPVLMERSVRQEGPGRRERRQRISDEASKQSGRAASLRVREAVSFEEGLARTRDHGLILLPYEGGGVSLQSAINPSSIPRDIVLWIGPEGGFAPEEVSALREAGATVVTLGPRILRAETAAISALTAVLLFCGEWE